VSKLILFIGRPHIEYLAALQKSFTVITTTSGKNALQLAQEHAPDILILDAVSMQTTGTRICSWLKKELNTIPVIHVHPDGQSDSAADAILVPPVSPRKLVNLANRLAAERETEDDILVYGPFKMNVSCRLLTAYGKESQLPPKQAALLEMFLRHPGQTLDRKTLMQEVWDTTYLGDTRTLDVHIRWIRKILEENGRRPRHLRTVRGIGYQLVIEQKKADQ
jgi:DNA-binding response OmpR family regulator